MAKFVIRGFVREAETGRGVSNLLVRSYDKDLAFDDLMGTAVTDQGGRFEIIGLSEDFKDLLEKKPDIYLKIYYPDGEKVLHTTQNAVRFQANTEENFDVLIPRHDLGALASDTAVGQQLTTSVYEVSASNPQILSGTATRNVGVCFSGGGSRSLSAVMGQLRGLKHQGWLDQVACISAVSGGCWASSLFTFLPASISYDDFLGTGADPSKLTWDGATSDSIAYLPPNNMGLAANRLGIEELLEVRHKLMQEGFTDWHQFWRVAIGQLVFKDFGLYDADSNHNPTHYYSSSKSYFDQHIQPNNPSLSADNFFFARNEWPKLIMNGSMFYPENANSIVPLSSTTEQAGIRAKFPQEYHSNYQAGGGFVDPFAFGSSFISKNTNAHTALVNQTRPFSVVDMASISSAAFAEALMGIWKLDGFELEYDYWTVQNGGQPGQTYTFADGGLIENAGLASMLANTDLDKIVVFVNGSQAVEHNASTFEYTQVPDAIPPLFGFQPIQGVLDSDGYEPYAGANSPKDPLMRHDQVFESNRFNELLLGLKHATDGSTNTAMFLQTGLKVVQNDWYGIPSSSREVDVLWVCNNKVSAWEGLITDSSINDYLDVRDVPGTPLYNFPFYDTITQLHLSPRQINMLAQLSWWNVTADVNQATWKKIFS